MLETIRTSGKLVTPENLPIAEWRDQLLDAIRDHQVVIVAGETGSGKSTQLPKLCLELGRGVDGLIGHTQPRRMAARTIAERVADELGTELGTAVGYTVRFTDKVRDTTLVKVMTDGILLAEIQRDRMLHRYDTIIVDEAHERSLNIDFLLGYLKQLLPKRPDLKVIVTSATIDTARFSEHFDSAPIVEVAGRTYPVEVRYRPYGDEPGDQRDQVQAVSDAIDELEHEGNGDVLVFLSGEREIHDIADTLRRRDASGRRPLEILPLYARLSAVEQHRIFQPHTGRRIVLSTNVAETSLTVPGVRYVIDAGSARISRYSHRLKVQRLPIEPVSQASANQRSGRCGRVAPGVCIRLYSDEDFDGRELFTEPEILRTNLASVILQMTALGLGDVAAFPFLDPPDNRSVRDGYALLEELGAIEAGGPDDAPATGARRLTAIGHRLARLPLDPRLGRMVLEADRHGCEREVMVIAAALSIQDPRERPMEKRQSADEMHRRFVVEGSDVLTLVKLWDHLREQQQALSSNQFRKLCRAEFLNYLRVREWQDLYSQIRQVAGSLDIRHGAEAGHPDRVHQAVLSGMLSHLGMRDDRNDAGRGAAPGTKPPSRSDGRRETRREYRGAHGSKFVIAPGSALSKKNPTWLIAAELVETNRLWGRMAATVQPEWAERIGAHLAKRSYGEPRWDTRRGAAVTTERVSLYGLPIVAGRAVGYDRVDPVEARAMFIRHALVEGDWITRHAFDAANREFLSSVRALEGRLRRSDLTDDDAVFGFFDQRVGADVVSTRHFDQWWKQARSDQPELLTLTLIALTGSAGAAGLHEFPTTWRHDDLDLAVSYRFEPGDPDDGVTVHVPLAALNRVTQQPFDWQISGLRADLVDELIRTLPKNYRREMVPLADFVNATNQRLRVTDEPLSVAVAVALTDASGVIIPPELLDVNRVSAHLRISFAIEDEQGRRLAAGKNLADLRRGLSGNVRAAIAAAVAVDERQGITSWDLGTFAQVVETSRNGVAVKGYPALVDDGDSVSVRVLTNAGLQARVMRAGVRRLMQLAVPVGRRAAERDLTNSSRLSIARSAFALDALIADCTSAAADAVMNAHAESVWDEPGFAALVLRARDDLADITARSLATAASILAAAADVTARLDRLVTPAVAPSVDDMREQLARLVRPGFVTATGANRLADGARYLRAIDHRIDKLPEDPRRDQARMGDVRALERRYAMLLRRLDRGQVTPEVIELGWMLEELRVSLFAQTVGTPRPVSIQRIAKALVTHDA